MRLLPDFGVGATSARALPGWWKEDADGLPVLSVHRASNVCYLRADGDGRWRGHWCGCLRAPANCALGRRGGAGSRRRGQA